MDKVILNRATKTVTLPKTGATVECYVSLTIGDVRDMGESKDNVNGSVHLLSRLIKGWNLYAEGAEAPLPINAESIGQLPIEDVGFLLETIKDEVAVEKKD